MSRSALRLDKRRPLKDGTYPIQIKVGYGTNLYLPTGIYLEAKDWDERLQVCTGRQARTINNILSNSLLKVANRILELKETGQYDTFTIAQLRQMLTDTSLTAPTIGVPTFGEYLDKVMELKTKQTRKSYANTKSKLQKYYDIYSLKFTDLNYPWYEVFIKTIEAEGLKRNTVSRYLKCIKAVIRYAEEDNIVVNKAYRKVDSKGDENTPMLNLPLQTMRQIRDTKITGKRAKYLDAFMLSFYLIGINAVDLLALTKDSVVNGRINYKRAKTGRNYSIKIEAEAQAIIDKYPGKKLLLSFGEDSDFFKHNCNKLLRSLVPGLTWYAARYTWANYAVELDIPKDTISESLGHAHGSSVTGIYIRYTYDKIDAANRQVIDYLNKE